MINQAGTSGGTARWGVQYDTIQSDALFQQVASLLAGALSSPGEPGEITRWEELAGP